jgi:hypothetical protein
MLHLRTGDFKTALQYGRRCSAIAETVEDSVAIALAHSILGVSLHLRGELADARTELEAALDLGPRSQRTTTVYLGFEGKILAEAILARNLWLEGHPDRAMEHARLAVEKATAMNHALTPAIALIWAISVFLWTGELQSAEAYIDLLISLAESHSMAPYLYVLSGGSARAPEEISNDEERMFDVALEIAITNRQKLAEKVRQMFEAGVQTCSSRRTTSVRTPRSNSS